MINLAASSPERGVSPDPTRHNKCQGNLPGAVVKVGVPRGPGAVEGKGQLLVVLVLLTPHPEGGEHFDLHMKQTVSCLQSEPVLNHHPRPLAPYRLHRTRSPPARSPPALAGTPVGCRLRLEGVEGVRSLLRRALRRTFLPGYGMRRPYAAHSQIPPPPRPNTAARSGALPRPHAAHGAHNTYCW